MKVLNEKGQTVDLPDGDYPACMKKHEKSRPSSRHRAKGHKTIWQLACDHEDKVRGGMATMFNYLASIHPETEQRKAELTDAWQRYHEQMSRAFGPLAQFGPNHLTTLRRGMAAPWATAILSRQNPGALNSPKP